MTGPLLVAGAAGALGLLALTVRRPALACALLALAIPLTAGMARGAVLPVLRVNEALLLVVALGLLLHRLIRYRPLTYTGLDVAVLGFCLLNVLVPTAVLLLSGADAALSDWILVLGPVQYLVVYLVYSRTESSDGDRRLFFNACMLASVVVAAVAVAEALDVAGVRGLLAAYYPTAPLPTWDPVYRPASLLGHYSAVGAFGLLNLLLALAIAGARLPGFPSWWLALVVGANLIAVVASETYAPAAALPVGAAAVALVVRRVPWRVLGTVAAPAMLVGSVALWSTINGRLAAQFSAASTASSGGSLIPETMQTRIDFWQGFFVPALLQHGVWFGTGTLMPPEVPRPLVDFVDNGYLWQLFRAGLPGLAVLLVLLASVAAAGWATRSSPTPERRAIGAVCLGGVISVVLLDTTSEYLTFTAVSQEFWMLVGLLTATALATRSSAASTASPRAAATVRQAAAAAAWRGIISLPAPALPPAAPARASLRAALARFGPGWALVRASGAVLVGFGLARALGFVFQVVSGRVLSPVGYGQLTYALAVANVAAVLLTTAPLGLSRFLSRSAERRSEQEAYLVNWLALVGLVLGASAVAAAVLASPAGLGGWLMAGLLANLLGVAALETYREVQRGLGRYTLQSVFYVLANGVQLVVVLVAAGLGRASPELFLIVYGLSSVAALVLVAPASRGRGLGVDLGALGWNRIARIAGFMRPVLLQAIFWNVWFNADLILLLHLRGAAETGTYGAAKAIANGFTLVPTAIAFVFAPRVARLAEAEVRGHLLRALGLTAVVTVPLAIGLMAVAGPLTGALFGGRYAAAALPLVVLLAGMLPYGLKSVLGSLWLGLGHPVVETVSSGVGMAVTLAAGLWLVPRTGAAGAAVAFSAGALAMLLVDGAVTLWAFGAASPRVSHLRDDEILAGERGAAPRPVLLVAEELGDSPDEGYVSFVGALRSRLGGRMPVVLHASRQRRWHGHVLGRLLSRGWQVVRAGRRREVRANRPAAVIYASRSSLTLPALLRARLLKRLCGGAPLVFVALQSAPPARPLLLRALAPDLLLLPTDRERDAARAQGVLAATVCSGVDLGRFRPPAAGERAALRERWKVPADDRVVLHVGHLREGRNLGVMAALAARPGVTAVVAASSWRGPESDRLREQLRAAGVTLVDGYVPNVEELYRLADCYVFPTVLPGSAVALPLSVLEALASDVPVVSTAFGALSERFGGVPGLELVEDPAKLAERALAACGTSVQTRQAVEPYSWDAMAGRLADLIDELRADLEPPAVPGAGRRRVIAARLRRALVARRDLPRRLLLGAGPGYRARQAATAPVELVEDAEPVPAPASPPHATAAVVIRRDGPLPSLLAAAALLGLSVEAAAEPSAQKLVDRALAERWPLIALPLEALDAIAPASLCAFVGLGGTLYVEGLEARTNPALHRLGESLGVALPEVCDAPAGHHLCFPGRQAAFAGVLAGASLAAACGERALAPVAGDEVLAWSLGSGPPSAAVAQRRVREGRVVLSVLGPIADDRLAAVLASDQAASLAVPLMLLRELYGVNAWHAVAPLANLTIDDPALRRGTLGLPYDMLAAQAREHGFHVTIATVPRELSLADEAVVRRLREQPELLSACYHGCDHDGYEFFLTSGRWTRRRSRSLEEQRAALWRAIEHGRRFAAERGCRLDRVMVFPYGVGPARIFGDLHRLGFVATCNFGDKYPLEAPVPEEPDLGLRPADLAWEGFPVLWRRGLGDGGYLLDLLLGRPALVFAHPRRLGRDFAPLVERARAIDRATHGKAVWRGLDEVARHAYLQRRDPRSGWQVLMTANEACLHNPGPGPRTYTVVRPHLPDGSVVEVSNVVEVGGRPHEGTGPIRVSVPAGGTVVVRLVPGGAATALAGRSSCTVFEPSEGPDPAAADGEEPR